MLDKRDFIHLEGWWIGLVVSTNEAVYGFSKQLNVNFVNTIGAVKAIHAKPTLAYGLFCSIVVLAFLSGMIFKIYQNAKMRDVEITFHHVISHRAFFIFILKYLGYSLLFIFFLHIFFSLLHFFFSMTLI